MSEPMTPNEAEDIAKRILRDPATPYLYHYHDLPTARINLNTLAQAYLTATAMPVEPHAVIHKLATCWSCQCSQTLPANLQSCACPCHPADRHPVSAPIPLPPEMEERIADIDKRTEGVPHGCLCGLPGCDPCAKDAAFDDRSFDDVRWLLDTIRTLQAQRDQATAHRDSGDYTIDQLMKGNDEKDADLSRLRAENEALRAAGADCFGLLKLFLPRENGAARNAVMTEEFPRFERIFNTAKTPQVEQLRPAAGKEKEG